MEGKKYQHQSLQNDLIRFILSTNKTELLYKLKDYIGGLETEINQNKALQYIEELDEKTDLEELRKEQQPNYSLFQKGIGQFFTDITELELLASQTK